MNSKKNKTYAAILVLCGTALLVDRLLAPPGLAAAHGESTLNPSLSPLGLEAPSGPTFTVIATPFPSVSSDPNLAASHRDLFHVTDVVRRAMLGPDAGGAGWDSKLGRPRQGTRAYFAESHRLDGIMSGSQFKVAIVNGRWLSVGDRLDGCTLADITGTAATFQCNSGKVTLSVLQSSDSSSESK